MEQTTIVVIDEKISSIIRANKILVMDDGKIVGNGNHHQLVADNAVYQEIYKTQKAREGAK